jgi:hypothetical protein
MGAASFVPRDLAAAKDKELAYVDGDHYARARTSALWGFRTWPLLLTARTPWHHSVSTAGRRYGRLDKSAAHGTR